MVPQMPTLRWSVVSVNPRSTNEDWFWINPFPIIVVQRFCLPNSLTWFGKFLPSHPSITARLLQWCDSLVDIRMYCTTPFSQKLESQLKANRKLLLRVADRCSSIFRRGQRGDDDDDADVEEHHTYSKNRNRFEFQCVWTNGLNSLAAYWAGLRRKSRKMSKFAYR